MGFRMRKSFKVAPGVRLNVSKSGVGMSAGVKGARVGAHSSGRQTTMIGNPIFGFGYMKTSQIGSKKRGSRTLAPALEASSMQTPDESPIKKPSFLAPKSDKVLYEALQAGNAPNVLAVGEQFPKYKPVTLAFAGLLQSEDNPKEAIKLLGEIIESDLDPAKHLFVKLRVRSGFPVVIGPGVQVSLPMSRDLIAFALASAQQGLGDMNGAIVTLESLPNSAHSLLALVDAYSQAGRHQDVVNATESLTNDDDITALFCAYRGVALRELDYRDAALAAFKEALKSKKRHPAVRHFALIQRARTHLAMNRKAQARKDLERILAEDTSDEGVKKLLATLQ